MCRIRKKKDKDNEEDSYEDLLLQNDTSNSFLYSSLNMEIVCSILKGINIVLREINETDKK